MIVLNDITFSADVDLLTTITKRRSELHARHGQVVRSSEEYDTEDTVQLAPPGPPPFVPPSIASLKLWLKADTIVGLVNNDPIVGWADSSAAGHDVINNNVPEQPLYKTNQQNSLPGVSFDGTDDFLFHADPVSVNTVYTMFAVLKFNSATGSAVPFRSGENAGYGLQKTSGSRGIIHRLVADCVNGAATTNAELWSAVRTSAPLLTFFVNTVSQVITNSTSNVLAPDAATYVGKFGGAGLFFAGLLFEILIYEAALGDIDRGTVETYLAQKWGIPV